MNPLIPIRASALFCIPRIPAINQTFKRFRKPSPCDLVPPDRKPCFDICNCSVERGNKCHARMISAFLYEHYWTREPSVIGLWMDIHSPYIKILTDKYSYSGDRLLALERLPRTTERKLVGVSVGNKIFPWEPDELEEWAHATRSLPERHRMYFTAHCYRSPNIFKKYNVQYIYEVEVIATAAEVTGQGVGKLLLTTALEHAHELRIPMVQVTSVSAYTSKICEKVGMKKEWSMKYSEFVDDAGQRVFFPRDPHHTVTVYIKKFEQG
ncbi:uncharacterized protein [Choristoneura fumiferana]|uniref:uncharacterized protein n=1 Tax=Choristoneura fumiferana TaxID=7141 RepID=UPI003D15959B